MGFSTSTSMPSSSSRQPTRACSTVGTATLAASTRPASASMSGKHCRGKFLRDLRGALGIRHPRCRPVRHPRARDRPAHGCGRNRPRRPRRREFSVRWIHSRTQSLRPCRRWPIRHPDARPARNASMAMPAASAASINSRAVEQQRAARVHRQRGHPAPSASLRRFSGPQRVHRNACPASA